MPTFDKLVGFFYICEECLSLYAFFLVLLYVLGVYLVYCHLKLLCKETWLFTVPSIALRVQNRGLKHVAKYTYTHLYNNTLSHTLSHQHYLQKSHNIHISLTHTAYAPANDILLRFYPEVYRLSPSIPVLLLAPERICHWQLKAIVAVTLFLCRPTSFVIFVEKICNVDWK